MKYLFRGKRKDNGEWVYGDYVRIKDGDIVNHYIYYFGEVDKDTVGQYTNVDIHGKQVFDGDILRVYVKKFVDDEHSAVYYRVAFDPKFRFWTLVNYEGASGLNLAAFENDENCVVAGNIYDNPELLQNT